MNLITYSTTLDVGNGVITEHHSIEYDCLAEAQANLTALFEGELGDLIIWDIALNGKLLDHSNYLN